MPQMPLPPRARCPHQPPSAPRSRWPHPHTSPRSSCRQKGSVSDTRTQESWGLWSPQACTQVFGIVPVFGRGWDAKLSWESLRHTRNSSCPLVPFYLPCILGSGVLLELLQAAHQLSLLVGRHAGKNSCSDEDLQGGDGSVLAPHPRGQHPARGSLQVGWGRANLGQQLREVLANHSEGLAVQRQVAGLREAPILLAQALPRKNTPSVHTERQGKQLVALILDKKLVLVIAVPTAQPHNCCVSTV